jgi:hypothetical protein
MAYRILTVLREVLARAGAAIAGDPTSWGLIAANIAVMVFALRNPPIVTSLFEVYFFECVIIGLFAVLKLFFIPITLGPAAREHPVTAWVLRFLARLFCAAFFLFHYGFFLICCAALIGGLEGEEMIIRKASASKILNPLRALTIPLLCLFASHAFSFIWNFLLKREYLRRTMKDQMISPYGRVFLMFFSLVVGGILVSSFRAPILMIVVFLPIKIMADLQAHFRDHTARPDTFMHKCVSPENHDKTWPSNA